MDKAIGVLFASVMAIAEDEPLRQPLTLSAEEVAVLRPEEASP